MFLWYFWEVLHRGRLTPASAYSDMFIEFALESVIVLKVLEFSGILASGV